MQAASAVRVRTEQLRERWSMEIKNKFFTLTLLAAFGCALAAEAAELDENATLATLAQRSTAMQRYAGGRLQSIWNPQVKHSDVDWWLRKLKSWNYYGDDAMNGRSSSLAAGMDMNTGKETRTGVYGAYNHTQLAGDSMDALQQDWRVGAYMGKKHGAVRQYAYMNYGKQGNHYTRVGEDVKYRGQIVELGAEYQYDLHYDDSKTYHVAPYVNMQASRYLQKEYSESALRAGSMNNNYLAGETGVELRREMKNMNGTMRLGYKRVLAGAEPELSSSAGLAQAAMDKDYLHLTLGGTLKLLKNLSATAEGGWLEGKHDRELMADVKLNWSF